ncbi:hypothetical protein HKX48_002859 [Thoreauomyces humboldtii]|nr:hypothetical protein HKX48_002859 [Thoreauomyces humboldtii]
MVRAALLAEDDSFTPAAEHALREIFSRFDKDSDKALSPQEMRAFAVAANGEEVLPCPQTLYIIVHISHLPNLLPPALLVQFDEDTIAEITSSFQVNEKGWLTEDGFIDMYHLQTLAEDDGDDDDESDGAEEGEEGSAGGARQLKGQGEEAEEEGGDAETETWKDLFAFGYDGQLKLIEKK